MRRECKNATRCKRCFLEGCPFGPLCIDLCQVCYNELRDMLRKWTNNKCWAEHDQHCHNNEGAGIVYKVNLK